MVVKTKKTQDRTKLNEKNRRYYLKHKGKIIQKASKQYKANGEKIKKQKREKYQINKAKETERKKKYYEANTELVNKRTNQYYQTHTVQVKKRSKNNYYTNRELKSQSNTYTITSYSNDIKKGPTNVCVCCGRLFFERSITLLMYSKMLKKGITSNFIKERCPLRDPNSPEDIIGKVCSNCKLYLFNRKSPPLSLFHKELVFPEIPKQLEILTTLEERFLALRIAFIQIISAYVDGQFKSKGRIVNVPTNPEQSIQELPRNYNNLGVIMVKLKKRKTDKRSEIVSSIRIDVVLEAAKWLQHSEVYRGEKIKINFDSFRDIISAASEKILKDCDFNSDCDSVYSITLSDISDTHVDDLLSSDSDDEDNDGLIKNRNEFKGMEQQVADDETCLFSNQGIVFAPGENNMPKSIIQDAYADSLTFIKIYAGTMRQIPKHLTYQKVMQSEISRYDRRCCEPYHLFYVASKLRILKMLNHIQLCMRQTREIPGIKLTASQLLNEGFVNNLTLKDYGYRVFQHDRGSPAFFAQKKKDVFAMIRQLGPPNVFLTLSSAETRWLDLLKILKSTVDNENVSVEDIQNLPYSERTRLISSDPVTVARYFDHKLRCMLKLLKQQKECILGNHYILDYFIRIEFQFRGSPHAHILLWLNNAPIYNSGDEISRECCVKFIDELITCENKFEEEFPAVQYQVHKHSKSCKKKTAKGTICRFHIPWFPMKETKILEPLFHDNFNSVELKNIQTDLKNIRTLLANMFKDPPNITFDEFLDMLKLSEENYYLAIRYSISKPTVFLKREVNAIKINAYNEKILQLFEANMDIQFITDVYSCAHYVINYISKSRGQLSKLLQSMVDEVRKGNYSIREKLRQISNVFLNAAEFSAQECVYFILAMPISMSSREVVFINTNVPENRVNVIKPKKQLEELDADSENVFIPSSHNAYINRPKKLANVCLADFIAEYSKSKSKKSNLEMNQSTTGDIEIENGEVCNVVDNEYDHDYDADDYEDDYVDENSFENYKKRGIEYVHRERRKVIRYVRFNEECDEYNYAREQLMLFYPWRNEFQDLINVDALKLYQNPKYKSVILKNKAKYIFKNNDNIDEELEEAMNQINNENEKEKDNTEDQAVINETYEQVVVQYEVFNDRLDEGDIAIDLGNVTNTKDASVVWRVPDLINDDEYINLMIRLNSGQLKPVLQILHWVKINILLPIYIMILGSAGVGKSVLMKALHQTLLRFYLQQPNSSSEHIYIMLCGPTGKASHNIGGVTLHSFLKLPVNQNSGSLIPLTASVRNRLYAKLYKLKFILIDEISMVGARMLRNIDLRLRQIFGIDTYFAGISIIAFGDFNQLFPVLDLPLYRNLSDLHILISDTNPLWESEYCSRKIKLELSA